MKKLLKSIIAPFGFFAILLVMASSVIWVVIALKTSLDSNGLPAPITVLIGAGTLLANIFTYKDLGELMVNGLSEEIPPTYHVSFSFLTVLGYAGGIVFIFMPIIGCALLATDFVGKCFIKRWQKPNKLLKSDS
ncbi:hypothetical protein ACEV86_22160 [Vibrio parahaemolyticus]